MRKNLLALSIAAMVGGLTAGAANAAVINDAGTTATTLAPTVTGVGHILVTPYFTTQGTNKTLLNIINTDQTNGKAVKLRYRGASNSDDVFDITIYLSPGDMWTADVAADADGFSRLVTNDNSCTLPSKQDIKNANNGQFKTNRVLNNDKAQTREGYIEILNTADIPPGTGVGGANSALYTAIKHVSGVAPCTQSVMDAQAVDLALDGSNAVARGYAKPTGSLAANWVVVNVAGFASHSGEAVAVRANKADGTAGAGNIVWFPQTTDAPVYPAGGDAKAYTADPLLTSSGFAGSVANYDFPDLSTPYTAALAAGAAGAQADLLTAALATTSVTNEYLTAAGFSTDWVFSMPTRRYSVALDYAAVGAARKVERTNNYFTASNTSLNAAGTQICVTPGAIKGFDREEQTQSTFVISPDTNIRLCGETSVLAFNNTGESVLNASIARNNLGTRYAEGWMTIATPAGGTVAAGNVNGLPIIGYAAAKVSGVNLGGTWAHRTAGR